LPVEKDNKGRVTVRSLPGQFPRAETTLLLKSIFWQRKSKLRRWIGTSLDYGLHLEVNPRLDRSFLLRTINENNRFIRRYMQRRVD